MSSGNSLTRRQRRGVTITQQPYLAAPAFTVAGVNGGAGTMDFLFADNVVPSTNAADYDDWRSFDDASNRIASIAYSSARTVRFTWVGSVDFSLGIVCQNSRTPLRSVNGAALGPFIFPDASINPAWPPALP